MIIVKFEMISKLQTVAACFGILSTFPDVSWAKSMSPGFRAKAESAGKLDKVVHLPEHRVGQSSSILNNVIDVSLGTLTTLGFRLMTELDGFVSLAAPSFMLTLAEDRWVIINPHIFGEASGSVSFTLKLLLLEATINLKLLAVKFSPLDWQVAWD